ncbi:MAG TPA: SLC13 family permease [Blastocatellia bacterium]|nr:SLC13 family permease [Blastocatellia bacterium]
MNNHLIITFTVLLVAMVLFLTDRMRADLIALLVLFALGITGVLTTQEAFSGFSRSAVITIASIFILAEALQRTGITEKVGTLLLRIGGSSERRLVVVVMAAGALLSLFMNNIAAASVLLPAVSGAARKAEVKASRLLMPLAFATILGGMATLLTTTNIVVSSLLRERGLDGFGVLDFAPVGLPIIVTGVAYMAWVGRRILPAESQIERFRDRSRADLDLIDVYRLSARLFRARVPAGSSLIGKPLAQSKLREMYYVNVIAVENGTDGLTFSPPAQSILNQDDILLLEGDVDDFRQRDIEPYLEILPARDWRERDFESPTIVVIEAMLSPRSRLIGQTLGAAHFREKFGMSVLAIWRAGEQIYTDLSDEALQFGDALLLQGPRERLPVLKSEQDLIVLSHDAEVIPLTFGKGGLALGIMMVTLIMAALDTSLLGEIMFGGALMMVLARVLSIDEAYSAIGWRSVFLVAGMLPMGIAMSKVGAAELLGSRIVSLVGAQAPLLLLAALFLLATLLTQAMNGAAVAAVIVPIAIQAAQRIGMNPRSLAMGVALATSMAFLTPLGHPVNILVMAPGGYRFRDYLKVGLPLTLLVFVLVMFLLPTKWPLR